MSLRSGAEIVAAYVASGLMGALAWWIKPVALKRMSAQSNGLTGTIASGGKH